MLLSDTEGDVDGSGTPLLVVDTDGDGVSLASLDAVADADDVAEEDAELLALAEEEPEAVGTVLLLLLLLAEPVAVEDEEADEDAVLLPVVEAVAEPLEVAEADAVAVGTQGDTTGTSCVHTYPFKPMKAKLCVPAGWFGTTRGDRTSLPYQFPFLYIMPMQLGVQVMVNSPDPVCAATAVTVPVVGPHAVTVPAVGDGVGVVPRGHVMTVTEEDQM